MANPYDRIIKTPAEKRADDFRKSIEPQPQPQIGDTTLSMEDLMQMEYQEGSIGVGTAGYIMPDETAGTILQEGGGGYRVPFESFQQALTPEQHSQFLMPFPVEPQAPDLFTPFSMEPPEEEAPWYFDLPHVPYVSPAAASVRDALWLAGPEVPGTIMGGIKTTIGEIFGQEAEDFYGKWYAGGVLGETEALEKWGFPLTSKLFSTLDTKTGFANPIVEELLAQDPTDPDAITRPGDLYRKIIDTHQARPMREQIFMGLIAPDIVFPVGGVVSKLYRGLKLSGKVAIGLVKNADDIAKSIDPQSVYYRFIDEALQEGERQIIIVSRDIPEGRRITVGPSGAAPTGPRMAWEAADEGIDVVAEALAKQGDEFQILPGNASRAEVLEAAAKLGPPKQASVFGPGLYAEGPHRAFIPSNRILRDEPAFAFSGVTDLERAGAIERFWEWLPKELPGLGDIHLPTDAFKVTRFVRPGKIVAGTRAVIDEDITKVAGMDLGQWAGIQRFNLRGIASVINDKWATDAAGIRRQAKKHFGIDLPDDQAGALARIEQRFNLADEDLARHHISHMRAPGVQIKDGYQVGPMVRKVNAPALAPDVFGDKELLHIIDGDDPYGAVVAAVEISSHQSGKKIGDDASARVLAFYPVVEGAGPGMFGRAGMQQILRQIGDIYPSLDNMDFAGKLAREGNTNAEQFIGTATESMAMRLSDANISDDIADALNSSFPRASSVDAARAGEAGVSAYGYIPKPTIEGYTHTLAERINEARGVSALSPWEQAALGDRVWPIKPGELLYDMSDYGSNNVLFDKPGLANKIAARVPGSARIIGVWNRAQLELDDPVRFLGHEVTLFKEINGIRAHFAVMAWRSAAFPDLGMKEIRSLGDIAMNKKGIWRAQKVTGYEARLVDDFPTHGTIDDILKDADEVKKGIRVPADENGLVPGGKKKQVYFLNEKQKAHINMGLEMMEQNLRRNQRVGVNVRALAENYWHRMLIGGPAGKKSQQTFDEIWDSLAKKLSDQPLPSGRTREDYMFERVFDDLDDAVKQGFIWETDPALRLLARLNAGIDSYAHKMAWDKVLKLKTAEGKPFMTRAQRAADKKWFTEGPQVQIDFKAAREARVIARKLYKANPTPANEIVLRRADAAFITAYRQYRSIDAMANPNLHEYFLGGRINDRALIDEIIANIDIPQVQRSRRGVAPFGDPITEFGAEVAQISRALLTNADLAGMFINGQTLLWRNTAAWFTAVRESTKALVRTPWAYVEKNIQFMDEGGDLGGIIVPTEYMFTQTGLASYPTRLPLFGPAFKAFQRAFEWFIVIGQTEMYKATRTKVFKGKVRPGEFIPLESDEARNALIDLNKAIRKELGTESHAILGIRPTQRTLESLTAFAARFMRANIGLISLALRPTRGADSIEAKRALMSMLAGVTAMTTGIHYVQTGRPPNFHDPYAADWFQFPIGKTYFNLMGPLYSYFRTVARISEALIEGDEAKAYEQAENFLQGRAGIPIRAMGITREMMVTGEYRTFEGEEITGVGDIPTLLAEFAEPIAVGGVTEAIKEGRYEAIAGEVFGLQGRATPNAQMDILFQQAMNDPQHELYRRRARMGLTERGKTWYDADPYEKKLMEEEFPTIAEDIVRTGRGPYGDASREWEEQDGRYITQQIELANQLHKPVSPEDLEKGVRPVDGIEYRDRLEGIQKRRWTEHEKTIRDYELFQEEPEADDRFEQAMFDYHKVFELSQGAGDTILWGIFDELMEKFEDDHAPEELEYVLSVSGLNNDDTAMQLRKDKRALREVWDWQEELVKNTEALLPEQRFAYEQYRNMSITGQKQVRSGVLSLLQYVNGRTKAWLLKREQEGDATAGHLEQKLVYWGYESAPVTEAGIELLKDLNDRMGYGPMVQNPELRRPEIYRGQNDTLAANEPVEDDAQWLQRLRSGR